MGMYKLYVYDVYDKNGKMVASGTAREIADKFYTVPQNVRQAGRGEIKNFAGGYRVVREEDKRTQYISNCKGADSFAY